MTLSTSVLSGLGEDCAELCGANGSKSSFWIRLNRYIIRLCSTHQFRNLQVKGIFVIRADCAVHSDSLRDKFVRVYLLITNKNVGNHYRWKCCINDTFCE